MKSSKRGPIVESNALLVTNKSIKELTVPRKADIQGEIGK